MTNAEAAAWAQAVLSALAILISVALAVGVSAWQARHNRQERRAVVLQARRERVSGVGALMADVYEQLFRAQCAATSGEPKEWDQFITYHADADRMERAVSALSVAPLHELGAWRLVSVAVEMRELGIKAADRLRHRREEASFGKVGNGREFSVLFDHANECMRPIVRALAFDEVEGPPLGEWKEFLEPPGSTRKR